MKAKHRVKKLVFRKRHVVELEQDVIVLANAIAQRGKWKSHDDLFNAAMRQTFRPLAVALNIPLTNYAYDQVALTPFKLPRRKAA